MPTPLFLVTFGQNRRRFSCSVCSEVLFSGREIKLNTTGAEFFNMGWANKSADGLICNGCGYVHTFMPGSLELWQPEGGYPAAG
jgi:hypothetical protein